MGIVQLLAVDTNASAVALAKKEDEKVREWLLGKIENKANFRIS